MAERYEPFGRPLGSYEYSPDELAKEARDYFEHCEKTIIENADGKAMTQQKTLAGLRKWLRVGKNWISDKAKNDTFSGIIAQIYDEIEEDVQRLASLGYTNPTIGVRNLAANFDWREKTENKDTVIVATPEDLQNMSDEELQAFIK